MYVSICRVTRKVLDPTTRPPIIFAVNQRLQESAVVAEPKMPSGNAAVLNFDCLSVAEFGKSSTAHGATGWLLLILEIKLLDSVSSEVKTFLLRDQRHCLPTFAKQLLMGNRRAENSARRELGTDAPRRS